MEQLAIDSVLRPTPPVLPSAGSTKGAKTFTVAEIVQGIRALIEQRFPVPIWVEGELSNCSYPTSGHIYFDLVDEQVMDRRGQRILLPCAFFRGANQSLKFRLENGMKVLCLGEVTTYEAKGQYQLRVLQVEPKGIGALQLAFEQLKKRLAAEGLFDEARKRLIPRWPERIGVITSRTGDAIHDILVRLRGHFHIVVLPVKVQGEGAAQEIAEAIRLANTHRVADVLIVGRGGGSLEDLWAFNEEVVARAIVASRIPVISAVGHEEHWAISDYAADRRASTPTHAAQLLLQSQQQLSDETQELIQGMIDEMQVFLDDQDRTLAHLAEQLRLLHPLHVLKRYTEQANAVTKHLTELMRQALRSSRDRVVGLIQQLEALSPLAVLARGYSITFRLPDRHVLTNASSVHPGEAIETKLAKGVVVSTVTQTHPQS